MKAISFEKMSIESSDILSRLQMKRVKGGHAEFCECTCTFGPGQWHYTAHGQPNVPAQPSQQAIMDDLTANCEDGIGSCNGCTNFSF